MIDKTPLKFDNENVVVNRVDEVPVRDLSEIPDNLLPDKIINTDKKVRKTVKRKTVKRKRKD